MDLCFWRATGREGCHHTVPTGARRKTTAQVTQGRGVCENVRAEVAGGANDRAHCRFLTKVKSVTKPIFLYNEVP